MMPEKIQSAYFEGNAKKLCRELSQVPFGERIAIQGMEQGRTIEGYMIVEIVQPTSEEIELFRKASREHREFDMVRVGDNKKIIKGGGHNIDPRGAREVLEKWRNIAGERSVSHTHWDTSKDPFPSYSDRMEFLSLMYERPDLECRVVFQAEREIRTFLYVGELEK